VAESKVSPSECQDLDGWNGERSIVPVKQIVVPVKQIVVPVVGLNARRCMTLIFRCVFNAPLVIIFAER
jgi:hypothetical protein